ncbi:EAL domain-containing protein [Marinomonas agarivorans]|nr:EAL domain-containing protein [Marinomonas agarivorans]
MQPITRPLILKQAFLSVLIAVLLSMGISSLTFSEAAQETRVSVAKEYERLLSLVEVSSEYAAFNRDDIFAERIVSELLNQPLIYRAELAYHDGDMLASKQNFDIRDRLYSWISQLIFPEVGHYTRSLYYEPEDKFVGKLSIWVDHDVFGKNFIDKQLDEFVALLLENLLLTMVICFLLFVFVMNPLNRLTKVLRKHGDDISKPLPKLDDAYFAHNELGALSDTFSQLWQKLSEASKALERSDTYSKAIISQAGDAIYIADVDGQIALANKEAGRIIGIDRRKLESMNLRDLHANGTWHRFYQILIQQPLDVPRTVETQYQSLSGEIIPIEIRLIKYVLHEEAEVLILARDISSRKKAEDEIHQLAYYDGLTNLPNRHLIMEKLREAVLSCRRDNIKGALLLLDLDRFKNINDSLGHDVGDQLLQVVAKSFDQLALGDITVGRLGGDEFVFLIPYLEGDDEKSKTQVAGFAKQVVDLCNKTHHVGPHELHLSVSIGITFFTGQEEQVGILLKQADTALYNAKDAGRHTYRFYEPEMQAVIDDRLALEKGLHRALLHQEFELYYQPQNRFDGELIGAEALIRWRDGDQGFIPPNKFIPLAEELGVIITLGEWVIESAFDQLKQWIDVGLWRTDWTLSINVSPLQFQHPEFIHIVERLLKKYSIPADLVDFELTENTLLNDLKSSKEKMEHIRSLGIHLSIDDFGTGYSSLRYLKNLPISRLKIDQAFVRDLLVDMDDAAIVSAVIALAGALSIEVIAEGVESRELLVRLQEMGCKIYQGYLFGKPTAPERFVREHLHH